MFTKSALPKTEYCLPSQNVNIDKSQAYEPAMALLWGISKEKGLEFYMLFPKSVNIPKFKEYLVKLREVNGDAKICLFMDNLTTHTSPKTKAEMRRLNFRFAYNIPNAPDYNPIESVFSKIKQSFKCLRLQKLIG